jgi:glycosyltransferase involved in cell wall biosynthesis
MEIEFEEPVLVITPTIGSEHLTECCQSVIDQTYSAVDHLVVTDGPEHFDKVMSRIVITKDDGPIVHHLPWNVGSDQGMNFYGHRIYAGMSKMIPFKYKYIFLLDEDNWFLPEHVESCVQTMKEKNCTFSYSLRSIFDKDGTFLCNDNCESLGKWPIYCHEDNFHIDTSSWCIEAGAFRVFGHFWMGGWGADRQFLNFVRQAAKEHGDTELNHLQCTGRYTSCYRLEGNDNSVNKQFFEQGNKMMREKYGEEPFPWQK